MKAAPNPIYKEPYNTIWLSQTALGYAYTCFRNRIKSLDLRKTFEIYNV